MFPLNYMAKFSLIPCWILNALSSRYSLLKIRVCHRHTFKKKNKKRTVAQLLISCLFISFCCEAKLPFWVFTKQLFWQGAPTLAGHCWVSALELQLCSCTRVSRWSSSLGLLLSPCPSEEQHRWQISSRDWELKMISGATLHLGPLPRDQAAAAARARFQSVSAVPALPGWTANRTRG